MRSIFKIVFFLFVSIIVLQTCNTNIFVKDDFRKQYQDQNAILHIDSTQTNFYKLHFKNGDAAILTTWQNTELDSIVGRGQLYDFKRNIKKTGYLSFHINEIIIGETNDYSMFRSLDKERKTTLGILIAFNLALNVNCALNPKSCFGSCPTFYVEGNDDLRKCNAEGFSHAITPSLKSTDLDALQYTSPGEHFELTVKNEALETHVIDKIELLAIPKSPNHQVLQSNDGFYECTLGISPSTAHAQSKDIKSYITAIDNKEYFSVTDSTDLFTQQELIIEFDKLDQHKKGLVLNFRQSLITTFLLYNTLSLLGDEATDFIALYERNKKVGSAFFDPILEKSYIKIHYWNVDKNKWQYIKDVYEIGPIAKNKILVNLPNEINSASTLKIKLTMPKGHWRIDYVGISNIVREVKPLSLFPEEVIFNNHVNHVAKQSIGNIDNNNMISLPGDHAILKYDLPCIQDGTDYELFVSATGYYLEWMRKEWLQDKNIDSFKKMMGLDKAFWKELAIQYKNQEAESEALFWNSSIKKAI